MLRKEHRLRSSASPPQCHQMSQQSMAFEKALMDPASDVSRFLLRGMTEDTMQSMGTMGAGWYAICLEPMAYAIFGECLIVVKGLLFEKQGRLKSTLQGALFTAATWVFECMMFVALACNIFLALWASGFWMFSLIMNSRNSDYCYNCGTVLTYLQSLLMIMIQLVQFGLFIAAFFNMRPYWVETYVAWAVIFTIYFSGNSYFGQHFCTLAPLEFFHFPLLVQLTTSPQDVLVPRRREKLRKLAFSRARFLEHRALSESAQRMNTNESEISMVTIKELLQNAKMNMGLHDYDTSSIENRLEADLFLKVAHLHGRSVECLSNYMPLRLAEEVHHILGTKCES
ncbi:hypothetical protein THAOC_18621 [Thalassiosira oceanica]|uniref:Uncharacterized protein n=1 Tax=Thalassiosira oceanica TaxID=159749 RepID=K0SRJ8_THAOC|nr:hypothetical protein THAOC_18621 [Thalassiosira oceanica]|eukprot:EJK60957.1 hypothetical protein THAOC_18621 [Thalassiosira oceanica]